MRRVQTTREAVAWNVGWTPVSYNVGWNAPVSNNAEITTIWWWTPIASYDGNYNTAREAERAVNRGRYFREMIYEMERDQALEQARLEEIRNQYTDYIRWDTPTPTVTSTDSIGLHWETIQLVSRSTYERWEQNWTLDNNVVYYVYEDDDFTGKWEEISVPPKKEIAYFID